MEKLESKVFDWTIETDREEYRKQQEQDELDALMNPPQDERSKLVREHLRKHPHLPQNAKQGTR
jgi:hypothetical protein